LKRIITCFHRFGRSKENFYIQFSVDQQQVKAQSKEISYPSRDANLAPITEDEEQPSENANDDDLSNSQQQQQDDEEVKN